MESSNSSSNTTASDKAPKVDIATWIPVVFVGVVTLVLNGILCLAFATHRHLRQKSPNILICCQAAADGVNSILFIPFHTLARYGIDGDVSPFTTCYSLFLSLFSLLALAVDRYLLIVKPIYHRKFISVEKTRVIVVLIWIIPGILSLIPLTWWYENPARALGLHIIFTYSIWLIVVLATIIMLGMYAYIFWFVKHYIRQKRDGIKKAPSTRDKELTEIALLKKELRVTRLFASLLIFFALVYTPIVYINIVILVGEHQLAPPELLEVSLYLFIGNSVANPILCLMLKKDYQTAVLGMIGCRKNRVHPQSTGSCEDKGHRQGSIPKSGGVTLTSNK